MVCERSLMRDLVCRLDQEWRPRTPPARGTASAGTAGPAACPPAGDETACMTACMTAYLAGDVAQVAAGGGEIAGVKGPAAWTTEGTKHSATGI